MKNNRTTWIFIFVISTLTLYFLFQKENSPADSSIKNTKTNTSQKNSMDSEKPEPTRKISSEIPTPHQAGNLSSVQGSKPVLTSEAVLEWLRKNQDMSRFEFQADTILSESLDTDFTKIYYYQQTYKGFKVFNQHLRVIVKKESQEILRVKNHLYDVPPLASEHFEPIETVKQTVTQNLKISRSLLSSNMTDPEVFVQDGKSYLIWRIVQKSHPQKEPEQTLFVDASTGAILKRESTRMY